MVTTDDESLAEKIRVLRNQGSSQRNRYQHDVIGYCARLNTINAAIGRVQLRHLDAWNEKRRQVSETYFQTLLDCSQVQLPLTDSMDNQSSWHLFVVRSKERDHLREHLQGDGIETGIHYPIPIHQQGPYQTMPQVIGRPLPHTESWSKEVLSLPIYGEMSQDECARVTDSIISYYKGERA